MNLLSLAVPVAVRSRITVERSTVARPFAGFALRFASAMALAAGVIVILLGIQAAGADDSLTRKPTDPNDVHLGRVVTSYALTAPAHLDLDDHEGSAPRDWRLLGSNDDGRTWQILDV